MSEDINDSMPTAGPERLPSLPDKFKPGRFASRSAVPHNPKKLDDETRKAHAIDPYAGIILPTDAASHAVEEDEPKPKESKEPDA